MGFFGKVGGALTGRTSVAPQYMLTDRGEEKLSQMRVEGREFDMLASIKKLQPTPTARDIAKDLGWKVNVVETALNYLESEGLIQHVE